MAFCAKCGTELNEDAKFCPSCGTQTDEAAAEPKNEASEAQTNNTQNTAKTAAEQAADAAQNFAGRVAKINDTADTTAEYDLNDIQQNKAMAILSYISLLVLVPIFGAKHSKFAQFHANQGLVLLICSVAYGIVDMILTAILGLIFPLNFYGWIPSHGPVYGVITTILGLVNLVFVVLMILGIINAATGKAKELPVIGKTRLLKY